MPEIQIAIPARDGLLHVGGPDAAAFLQGQLSNDIQTVSATRGQLSSLNSARGRVLAVLRVYAADDGFLLAMPHAILPDILVRLQRYVLRSKVTLEDVTLSYKHLGVWGREAPDCLRALALHPDDTPYATTRNDGLLAMRLPGATHRVELWIPAARFAAFFRDHFDTHEPLGLDSWQALDIDAGLASLTPATQDRFVAQSLGLDTLGAINFRKGCYTGQEVIARLHYLGKAKRGLYQARLDGETPPAAGTAIQTSERSDAAGHVVNSARTSDGVMLLAVLPTELPTHLTLASDADNGALAAVMPIFPQN